MKLYQYAIASSLTALLIGCSGDDNDDKVRDLTSRIDELSEQLVNSETDNATQRAALETQIAELQTALAASETLSAEQLADMQEALSALETELEAATYQPPMLGSAATTGPNLLAKDNPNNVWKFAVFPDMQGRDDDDYSVELRHTNPDGSEVTNEALTRSGSFYVGIDVNKDGIWDGSSHQIDVSDPLNPSFVLDDNGFAIPVASAERKDVVGDWKVLPYPYAEPVIDKIIEEGVDTVLFLGDYTEHRSEHEYVQFREYIVQPLLDAGIQVVPIRGNHEIVNGRNWLAWFSSDFETAKTSVNNVDNGVDVYAEGDDYDQGYKLYRHYVGSLLDDRIASGEITPYSAQFPDLAFYYVENNSLFIALDPYFGDLVSTRYRGTWLETYDWLREVIETNAPQVDHIVVFNHESFLTKRRPQMYEENSYNVYLSTLNDEFFAEFIAGESDDERPAELDLQAYDMGQLGFLIQQAESQPNLTEDLFSLFARYNVHYLVGHDHQYSRSAIHAVSGNKNSPFFTQIISGNASWKAYENNFGTNALFESSIAQQNFIDQDTGHSSAISFVIAEVNNRQVTYTNHYTNVSFKDEYASENKLRYDYDNNQWNFFEDVGGIGVNTPIPIEWKVGDVASYTNDATKRIVGPAENYFSSTQTVTEDGYIGTEFSIIDGANITYNSSQAYLRNNEIQNMSELLALSWFSDNDDTTLSDIILINGNQNQDGTFFDYEGVQQTTHVSNSSIGVINQYGSRNVPVTTIEEERTVSVSPSMIFNNRNGIRSNNPTMVTRDGEIVKGTDYAAEHAKDYGPMNNLYSGDNIIGENGFDFADAMAVMMTVPADVTLEDVTLGRWDNTSESWVPVFNDTCWTNTGYSDHYSVLYRLDEQEPEGGFGIDGCEQQYWGYNPHAHALWGFIHTDGLFAIIYKPTAEQ